MARGLVGMVGGHQRIVHISGVEGLAEHRAHQGVDVGRLLNYSASRPHALGHLLIGVPAVSLELLQTHFFIHKITGRLLPGGADTA
jgi:hypothetical protein